MKIVRIEDHINIQQQATQEMDAPTIHRNTIHWVIKKLTIVKNQT